MNKNLYPYELIIQVLHNMKAAFYREHMYNTGYKQHFTAMYYLEKYYEHEINQVLTNKKIEVDFNIDKAKGTILEVEKGTGAWLRIYVDIGYDEFWAYSNQVTLL